MVRSSTLLLCLLLGTINPVLLNAQQPFPTAIDQPRWIVDEFILGMPLQTDAFFSAGQLELCGNTFNVVDGLYGDGELYYRNDGQRTLYRRSSNCADKEYLLYDFSLNLGDTTFVGWEFPGDSDTSMAILQSIDTILVLGNTRRQFTVLVDYCAQGGDDPWFIPIHWIEGIGSPIHPFYSVICLCDFCEFGAYLVCADSLGIATYRFSPDVVCDFTVDLKEIDTQVDRLVVYGTEGLLQVKYPAGFKTGTLSIIDGAGRQVFAHSVTENLSSVAIPGMASGTYTVVLQNVKERWVTKWVWLQ